ncbi:Thioredoxin-related transmembrane protein 1 [Araneus ventricosus]|uniref:Thioredoxin-related transmembrane protein 1 n=1 Tax=Araneus ventricosus TaxID=182803 RepID=A0A4Y2LPF1_ARAVE|nr:Thioredoxin-related transmembrane protein 1 [Araneus ventricosus]
MLHEESMVAFFSPCCPACQQLEPLWKEFAEWSKDLGIKVGNIDVTTSPSLSVRFMITEVPKIFHVKDGVFRQYRGARDKKSFISFVEEKKWKSIDPVPRWKSPQSYLMTAVAFVFKLPMFLKSMYNTLMEDVIPAVGCY